jgi:G3E family GTPase
MTMQQPIPVTVLTGYLGAGKTTLLNRVLSQAHGRRYAVIVNEFGEIGIDGDLIVGTDEELFEMSNGCVCCSVRGDLIRTLHELLRRPISFDAIVIETTGLADPGPVAQTFLVDHVLQRRIALDSITTVVDARHIRLRLDDSREAREQIAFADQIVLNKIELVSNAELCGVEALLRSLNPLAPIHRATRADVPLDLVLERGGFDLERISSLGLEPLDAPVPDVAARHGEQCGADCDQEHHSHEHSPHDHIRDADIASVSLRADLPMDGDRFSSWLSHLVATRGTDILRLKGIIHVAGEDRRLVVQAVHMLLEGDYRGPWPADVPRASRLVLIGRRLDASALRAAFLACVTAHAG